MLNYLLAKWAIVVFSGLRICTPEAESHYSFSALFGTGGHKGYEDVSSFTGQRFVMKRIINSNVPSRHRYQSIFRIYSDLNAVREIIIRSNKSVKFSIPTVVLVFFVCKVGNVKKLQAEKH
ncbi:hypothetical protein [Chenggangzhangella methanolivorans]|uniref:Uncharacterized protein n=1 Tax=Chenggangzhangella methanolivorans TaxID=1437009 RepID=A0A9E6UGW0_9HYPH|nr:hypothetical protein [Chenggangzhangella methanolivorans]QZN99147.1 hypothetical protein K6K41_20250 [Chenggangzhangella methanolivorans]